MSKRGGKSVRGAKPSRGGGKQFSSFRDLAKEQSEVDAHKWSKPREQEQSDSDSEGEIRSSSQAPKAVPTINIKGNLDSDEEVAPMEVRNLNDVSSKQVKLSDFAKAPQEKVELSRRERETLAKEAGKAAYMKAHLAGKTEESRSDMARLAIIRKKREEDAARKLVEVESIQNLTLAKKATGEVKKESLNANKASLNAYGF